MSSEAARVIEPVRIADRYTIIERIATGGCGVVYRARDEVSGRIVAFKQLVSAQARGRSRMMEALFEREYRTLVRLRHPRIIEVYDYGVTPEGPYYTMELLEGSDLAELGKLPYVDVCRHLRDVASSLALLHAQRFVHRDVSPRNVRVTSDGTARLLDFGALASFGASAEIVGTPAFMAPEVLLQLTLDPRTDLYSLGAVGYFSLTGRPAFPARSPNDLPRLWQSPPVPPSAFAPDVPPELDRLILSMLSQDRLGRPETAAAVIDQLTVIARLPPEPHERAEQSYLLSSPMVGRGPQMDWVLGRIEQALAGRGGETLIEGSVGIGKTRLVSELGLAATLKGVVTARADGEATPGGFGVAVALGQRLIEACPEIARRAAEPHLALLRALAPELADALGGADSGAMASDPSERRLAFHRALREWFIAVSRERALLLSVDNLQAADDDSVSLLAALGRESRSHRLFVLGALRTGSPVVAPEAVRLLRARSTRVKLRELDRAACEQLAGGLFGGAQNAGRVGRLLQERSGGVPRQLVELSQLMVQKKIATYEAGGWVLPLEVAHDELPTHAEELASARLAGLGADAVGLARALAVHAGATPLSVALAVSDLGGEGRTYAVLDELIAEQVLASEGGSYRFLHEAIREAVLAGMDAEAKRTKRLRAAEVLLALEEGGVTARVEAALQLIDAGEERRGAGILVTAARELAAGAGTHQSPDRLVRALCDLVRRYDREGRSDYELGALLFPLMPLAYYSANWQFMLEYGKRAIDIGIRITGLARAGELEPELGREEALKRGLGQGMAGFASQPADGIPYDLKTAIAATIGMVPASVAVYATCLDPESVAHVVRAVAPLTLFGEQHVAYPMYLFAAAEVPLIHGSEAQSRELWARALTLFEAPACAAAIGESRAKALLGGVLFSLAILDCYCFGDRALDGAKRMEGLGVKAWEVAADQVRILYHSLRGEAAEVKTYMDRVELNVVEGAQTWQAEVYWPALLLNADVLTGDAMAARRRYVQLQRRSREAPSLEPQAEAARAAYLMLRGDVREAVLLYERLLPRFPVRGRVGWETTRAYFACALNLAGEHERARTIAEAVVSNMQPGDDDLAAHFLEARRQLALAESGLGNHARAGALLDELIEKHGDESNALLVGLLHQARAEVAERAGDTPGAEKHRAEMEDRFRRTANPVLVARCERVLRAAARRSDRARAADVEGRLLLEDVSTEIRTLAAPVDGPALVAELLEASEEPLEAVLELVMRQMNAGRAALYVPSGGALRLAWSSTNEAPSRTSVEEAERWLEVLRENDRDGGCRSVLLSDTQTASGERMVALRSAGEGVIVGALVLDAKLDEDVVGSSYLFDALARVVEAEGEEYVTA